MKQTRSKLTLLAVAIATALLLTGCWGGTTGSRPNPTATVDLCPNDQLAAWLTSVRSLIEDSELLYGVADSCEDTACLRSVSEEFLAYADRMDVSPPPPPCAEFLHEMIRQTFIDEGRAFEAEIVGDTSAANEYRRRALARMETIDRYLARLTESGYTANLAHELEDIAATETARPVIETTGYCLSASHVMNRWMSYDFEDFKETRSDDGLIKLELEELDSEAHGRIIVVFLDGNCTKEIITLISYGPDMPEDEFERNQQALTVASSMGAEQLGFTDELVEQLHAHIPDLRERAGDEVSAEQTLHPIPGEEYPKVYIELRTYDGYEEALMYSIEFMP